MLAMGERVAVANPAVPQPTEPLCHNPDDADNRISAEPDKQQRIKQLEARLSLGTNYTTLVETMQSSGGATVSYSSPHCDANGYPTVPLTTISAVQAPQPTVRHMRPTQIEQATQLNTSPTTNTAPTLADTNDRIPLPLPPPTPNFTLQLNQSSMSAMATAIANESSNLSSAGSTSDGLADVNTPEKMASTNPFAFGSPSSYQHHNTPMPKSNTTKDRNDTGSKTKRKRRRQPEPDGDSLGATKPAKVRIDKKTERSIVDYMQSKGRNNGCAAVGSINVQQLNSAQQNNQFQSVATTSQDGNSVEILEQHLLSPGPSNNRTTPTHQIVGYASSDGSGSNQSPPGNGRSHAAAQTEMTMTGMSADSQQSQLTINSKSTQIDQLHSMIEELKSELLAAEKKIEERDGRLEKCRDITKKLLIDQSKLERKAAREKCIEGRMRLGQPTMERRGAGVTEVWVEGSAFQANHEALKKIKMERESMEDSAKTLKKKKPNAGAVAREARRLQAAAAQGVSICPAIQAPCSSFSNIEDDDSNLFVKPEPPRELSTQEYYEQDEIYKLRREALKKEEAEVSAEKDRLEREYKLHQRELKRIQNEDSSRYKDNIVLGNNNYLLLTLLGKGGFSEVWKAYDLEQNQYVACKIHHVNKDWKEEKKCNYVKHATREMRISETLYNARIVRTYATVTIDKDSFFTVLEYCDGNDLDFYLKQNKTIPEKEARSIIMQVVSGLKYLNSKKPPIIHYDLKPANILLQSGTASGEIKITDFGLSKMMPEDTSDDGMTLTSPGAGTYWYLPPECFGGMTAKIDTKVDVWSVGVIFYQCLYGKRPFGDELSQSRILQDKVILRATEVSFPSTRSVSNDAKTFIRCCLQYRKEDRADVHQLAMHEYLRPKMAKASAAAVSAQQALAAPPSPQQPQSPL